MNFSARSHFIQVTQPPKGWLGSEWQLCSFSLLAPPQSSSQAETAHAPLRAPKGQRPLGMVLVVNMLTECEDVEGQEAPALWNDQRP